jgi:ABC-type transport system involved in cytochrome bd biosynthesis fused ATPase/permease subunit
LPQDAAALDLVGDGVGAEVLEPLAGELGALLLGVPVISGLRVSRDAHSCTTSDPLSAGQQQRIAIARAVYHRPPVLLFDEATSSLDSESERAVKENVDELLEGRTSFVIVHRLSTIRDADLIVVLERGRLVERGTHDELIERRGLYYYLLSQQLEA